MSLNINDQQKVFSSVQTLVVYQQFNAPRYPAINVLLAPSTDATLPTYSAGRLLAQYGADAPSADLVGMYVNYDPASAVVSQQKCVAVLSAPFVQDLPGVDVTSTETMTATINRVEVTPLLIGTSLYLSAIENANDAAVVTAFEGAFTLASLGNVNVGMEPTQVVSIQAVL